jgi:hypothetical protein
MQTGSLLVLVHKWGGGNGQQPEKIVVMVKPSFALRRIQKKLVKKP